MKPLPILFGYKAYEKPKTGEFLVIKENAKYILPGGWETEIQCMTIIGEDKTSYVYRLQPSEQGRWVGEKVITEKFILPIGVHKSRLIRWQTNKLELF